MPTADVKGVESPGLRDVDDTRVLLPENRVIPQPGDPERYQQEGECEGGEEEKAVAVQEEALALLVQDEGQHGEEGEDEEDEDLALGDQVPVVQATGRHQEQGRPWHPPLSFTGSKAATEVHEEDEEEGDVPHAVTQVLIIIVQQLKGVDQRLRLEILDDGVLTDRQVVLVATEEQAVVDRVAHQVDAGTHDEDDDAHVGDRARQGTGTAR